MTTPTQLTLDEVAGHFDKLSADALIELPPDVADTTSQVYAAAAKVIRTHRTALEAGMQKPIRFYKPYSRKYTRHFSLVFPEECDGEISEREVWFDTKANCERLAQSLGIPCEFVRDEGVGSDDNCSSTG